MQPLVNGKPGPDETWEELAEHALDHDNVVAPPGPAEAWPPAYLHLEV